MSGGSMDYLYSKIDDVEFRCDTALRRAFRIHLKNVSKALHDIEWVDSCDYGPGDENEAIRVCLAPGAEIAQLLAEAKAAVGSLAAAIALAEGKS